MPSLLPQIPADFSADRGQLPIKPRKVLPLKSLAAHTFFGGRLPSTPIEAFLGPHKKDLEKNHTMIMTPGWVRAWPEIMKALGWDEVDVRMNLGRYERILLLDCGAHPLSDEEILWFFDLAQIPIEIEPLDLGHFKKMLKQLLV